MWGLETLEPVRPDRFPPISTFEDLSGGGWGACLQVTEDGGPFGVSDGPDVFFFFAGGEGVSRNDITPAVWGSQHFETEGVGLLPIWVPMLKVSLAFLGLSR